MPNLAGILDMRDSPGDLPTVLLRLARVLEVPGLNYTVRKWNDDRFAAINLLNGICGNLDQPLVDADGGIVLFLDGEINNLPDVWKRNADKRDLTPIPTPGLACLELYGRYGDDFVKLLDGQFNILVYDRSHRAIKLFNDRLAYRPFYYWCADGLAVFALERKAIFAALGRTPPFDPMGVLEFATLGHNLGDRTIFAGVRALPQGSVLEIRDGVANARQYSRLAYRTSAEVGSVDAAARELEQRLSHAVMRRARDDRKYGVFLSGGLDSRAVAGALARTRRDVVSFTFGPDDSPDLVYGRQIAAELGFTFHRLSYCNISLSQILPRVVWRTEGAIPFDQTYSIAGHREIRPNASVIFNGHFGNTISGGMLVPAVFAARNARQLTKHILTKKAALGFPILQTLFRRSFLDETFPELSREIEQSILALGEDRLPLAYNLWFATVRAPRFTFCTPAIDRYVLEQATPFTDNEVVDLMLSLPIRHLFNQRVYKRMIVHGFPQIAQVPWTKTRRRVSSHFCGDLALQAWLFATKRVKHMIAPSRLPGPAPRVGDLTAYAKTRLTLEAFPAEVFDRDGVRKSIQAALDGSGPAAPLFVLLTLAECARLFAVSELAEPPQEARPIL